MTDLTNDDKELVSELAGDIATSPVSVRNWIEALMESIREKNAEIKLLKERLEDMKDQADLAGWSGP